MRPIVLSAAELEDDEVELVQWLVSDGSVVVAGSPVVEVSTAKVNVQVPAPASGQVRHRARPGDLVRAEEPLGWIVDE